VFHISIWGCLEVSLGSKPTKAPTCQRDYVKYFLPVGINTFWQANVCFNTDQWSLSSNC